MQIYFFSYIGHEVLASDEWWSIASNRKNRAHWKAYCVHKNIFSIKKEIVSVHWKTCLCLDRVKREPKEKIWSNWHFLALNEKLLRWLKVISGGKIMFFEVIWKKKIDEWEKKLSQTELFICSLKLKILTVINILFLLWKNH